MFQRSSRPMTGSTAAPPTKDVARRLLLPGLVIAGLAVQIALFHGLRHDDAFITYRYGQNLALGHGLVFNPGERIMGSTAPGHVFLSALVYRLAGQDALPGIMSALGCVGWMLQAVAIFFLFADLLGQLGALVLASVIALGGAGSAAWVALETNIPVALVLWAVVCARRQRWLAAAALCALAAFTRPDALIMIVPLGAWALVELRTRIWKPAALFLLILGPWLVFATMYFGSPIPQSAVAKFHRASFGEYLVHELTHLGRTLLAGEVSAWPWIALAWMLAVAGAIAMVRRARHLAVLMSYGALHVAAYLFLRPFSVHVWHLYPAVVIFELCGWYALIVAFRWLQQQWGRVALGTVMASMLLGYAWQTGSFAASYSHDYWWGARDETYRAVAAFLTENASPEDTVGAVEVGTIAYYSQLRMYDLGGLITRDPLPPTEQRPYRWFVIDPAYRSLAPKGLAPTAQSVAYDFPIRIYDLEQRREQLRSAAASQAPTRQARKAL